MVQLHPLDSRVDRVRVFFYHQFDKAHNGERDKDGGIGVQYNSERDRYVDLESNNVLLRGEEFVDKFLALDLATKLKLLEEIK